MTQHKDDAHTDDNVHNAHEYDDTSQEEREDDEPTTDDNTPEYDRLNIPVTHDDAGVKLMGEALRHDALLKQNKENLSNLKKQTRLTILLATVLVLCLLMLSASIFMLASVPKNRIINTVDNAVICEAMPTDSPLFASQTITAFAVEGALGLHSFNFLNADDQLKYILESYFTREGRVSISQVLKSNNMVNDVKASASIMKAKLVGEAVIVESSDTHWIVQFPIEIGIYGASTTPRQTYRRNVKVKVVPTLKSKVNARGLGIDKIEMRGAN